MSHTKLYIVGNGFDLHHGIRSRYADFKEFIREEDNSLFRLVDDYLPAGEDWSNLESALGDIDIEYMVEKNSVFLPSYSAEDWSDSGHHDFPYEIGKIVNNLSSTLRTQFANWVRQIDMPASISVPNKLPTLDKDGLYLTFNYTSTLTSVHSIPAINILHIHGEASMQDADIVLGHAWNPSERKSLNDHPDIEEQDTRVTEAYGILDGYFSATFKPSKKIIIENVPFFASLSNIEEVLVLGHSLSDVDRDYFEAVVKAINVDAVLWTIACRAQDDPMDKLSAVEAFGVPFGLIKTVYWETL